MPSIKRKKQLGQPDLRKISCVECGISDQRVKRQKDHVFSQHNSPLLAVLCGNCHDKKTFNQNKLPKKVQRCLTLQSKKAMSLVSLGSTLENIGKEAKDLGYKLGEEENENSTTGIFRERQRKKKK